MKISLRGAFIVVICLALMALLGQTKETTKILKIKKLPLAPVALRLSDSKINVERNRKLDGQLAFVSPSKNQQLIGVWLDYKNLSKTTQNLLIQRQIYLRDENSNIYKPDSAKNTSLFDPRNIKPQAVVSGYIVFKVFKNSSDFRLYLELKDSHEPIVVKI